MSDRPKLMERRLLFDSDDGAAVVEAVDAGELN